MVSFAEPTNARLIHKVLPTVHTRLFCGEGAAIVLNNADIEANTRCLPCHAYGGQSPFGVSRIFVTKEIAESFIDQLYYHIQQVSIGNPQEGSLLGPLISENRQSYISRIRYLLFGS